MGMTKNTAKAAKGATKTAPKADIAAEARAKRATKKVLTEADYPELKSRKAIEEETRAGLREEAAKGAKPANAAALARGLDSRNAPHSSKSVGDQRRAAPKAETAKAEPKAAPKKAAPKKAAPKAEKAAPAGEDTRKVTVLKGTENPHREDTNRHKAFEALRSAKTVAAYAAAGAFAKPKYLAKWEKAGLVKLG